MRSSQLRLLFALTCFLAAGCEDEETEPVPFEVVGCSLESGATNVSRTVEITLTFNAPPERECLADGRIQLSYFAWGTRGFMIPQVYYVPYRIPASIQLEGNRVRITPVSPLAEGPIAYGVLVAPNLRDADGRWIQKPFGVTFTTGDYIPLPYVPFCVPEEWE